MKRLSKIILILIIGFSFEGCSMIKKFLPGKKGTDDISYELIENLSTSFSASSSVLYSHILHPPKAGPMVVLCTAIIAFRPVSLSLQ